MCLKNKIVDVTTLGHILLTLSLFVTVFGTPHPPPPPPHPHSPSPPLPPVMSGTRFLNDLLHNLIYLEVQA